MNPCFQPRLFYDGRCGLCRREVAHLRSRLSEHFLLVDISDPEFDSWQGVDRDTMLASIHVWDGKQFLTGLEATLFYWNKVGWSFAAKLIRLPLIYRVADLTYRLWAAWRLRKNTHCEINNGR